MGIFEKLVKLELLISVHENNNCNKNSAEGGVAPAGEQVIGTVQYPN